MAVVCCSAGRAARLSRAKHFWILISKNETWMSGSSLFWSSSEEDDWDLSGSHNGGAPEKKEEAKKDVVLERPKEPIVVRQEKEEKKSEKEEPRHDDKRPRLTKLSDVDKTGLEGTAAVIARTMEAQKKGSFAKHQEKAEERVREKVNKLLARIKEVELEDKRGGILAQARTAAVQRELAELIRQVCAFRYHRFFYL